MVLSVMGSSRMSNEKFQGMDWQLSKLDPILFRAIDETIGNVHHVVGRDCDGTWYEFWYCSDKKDRIDGPAESWWRADGMKWRERWYRDGIKHRADGPQEIVWGKDGNKKFSVWYKQGSQIDFVIND